jgi:zinc transport system substrate-binding protein
MTVHRSLPAVLRAAAAILTLISCGAGPDSDARTEDGRPLIAVSVLPQKYFLEAIAGDRFEVKVLIPPGASPHSYEPAPSDMEDMERATLWFTIGIDFEEPWIPRFTGSCPDLRVVSTIDDVQLLPIDRWGHPLEIGEEHPDTGAEDQHEHGEGSLDPHTWLSPELARTEATAMAAALIEEFPDDSASFAEGLASFSAEIDSLQTRLRTLLEPVRGKPFMVFHPAWGYFADEFGLVQVPVEVGGNEPGPAEMAALIDAARAAGITTVFVSPQFSTASAEVLASEIGGTTAVLDPLAGNWAENLIEAAGILAGGEGPEVR